MELWDAYNRDFEKIENQSLIRGEEIPDGLYHLVCDVVVKHVDGTYLLMQRDNRKMHGGKWELSAGGSVLQGEEAWEGAKRELLEETGISGNNMTELGRSVSELHHSLHVIFLCVTDCNKEGIVLQEGETIAYSWRTMEEVKALKKEEFVSKRALGFLA